LLALLDGERDLDLKTHVFDAQDLAGLYTLKEYLKDQNIEGLPEVIGTFLEKYLRLMISWNRESRREIIQAISEIKKKMTMSFSERITSNQAKK
jgi:hypothetical protein